MLLAALKRLPAFQALHEQRQARELAEWSAVVRQARAEQWLRRAVYQPVGVGYRQDHQFDTWLDQVRGRERAFAVFVQNVVSTDYPVQ